MTRLVILESPYAGDVERNLAYCRAAIRDCLLRGEAPFASHALYTQPGVLDDTDPAERSLGIEAGLLWGERAAATVVYADLGITPGMEQGMDHARRMGRPVPCQRFTAYRRRGSGVGDSYLDLIEPTREALDATGRPYVIENVPGAPLRNPLTLCGSSFGLDVRRHRLFESNVPMLAPPCNHGWQKPRFPQATNRTNLRSTVEVGVWRIPLETQQAAMGIDWMELRELSEAIPPAYTRLLGVQLLDVAIDARWAA